ncbi:MAG: hypothetical protein JJ964_14065 [Rhizobiales bacterium]|nr:hypothetical protein [Hyphomicrobiales bacterium]
MTEKDWANINWSEIHDKEPCSSCAFFKEVEGTTFHWCDKISPHFVGIEHRWKGVFKTDWCHDHTPKEKEGTE